MRIAYIVNQLRRSGPINVLYDIIRYLDLSMHDIYIICLMSDNPQRSIASDFEKMGAVIIRYDYSFWNLELQTKKVASQIEQKISALNIDLVHTHGYHPVLVASHFKAVPTLETLHNICWEDFVFSKGYLLGNYMISRYTKALKKINHYAAITDAVKNSYSSTIDSKRIKRIYNGCDCNLFKPITAEEKKDLRMKLNIPLDKTLFLVVGALSKRKDPMVISRAYRKLVNENRLQNSMLIFVGIGDKKEECLKILAGCDSAKFIGYVFNTNEYYRAADFTISASHSEGFGLNFIESLMCGIPVIGTRIPAFLEFSQYDKQLQDLLFTPGSVEELEEKILSVLYSNIHVKTEIFKALFSSSVMSYEYNTFYQYILANSHLKSR